MATSFGFDAGVDVGITQTVTLCDDLTTSGEGVKGGSEGGDVEATAILGGGKKGAGGDVRSGDAVVGGDLEIRAGAELGRRDESGGLTERGEGRVGLLAVEGGIQCITRRPTSSGREK